MSDLKRDLPKEAFQMENTNRINIENEVMRKIDQIEPKKVKSLGVRPQMMGFIMACFFFFMALLGVLLDTFKNVQLGEINGVNMKDVFGKIPVELHFGILFLSAGFLVYLIYQSLTDLFRVKV